MQLDVQWFISALVDNELITLADAVSLGERLGGDPDLATYAQAVCDALRSVTTGSEFSNTHLTG